ncbi:hypothetical protein D3C76_1238500 [compost metagenome]
MHQDVRQVLAAGGDDQQLVSRAIEGRDDRRLDQRRLRQLHQHLIVDRQAFDLLQAAAELGLDCRDALGGLRLHNALRQDLLVVAQVEGEAAFKFGHQLMAGLVRHEARAGQHGLADFGIGQLFEVLCQEVSGRKLGLVDDRVRDEFAHFLSLLSFGIPGRSRAAVSAEVGDCYSSPASSSSSLGARIARNSSSVGRASRRKVCQCLTGVYLSPR